MTQIHHCMISIQANDIFSIRQTIRKTTSPLFQRYSVHTYSLKIGQIVVKFETDICIESDTMIEFLLNPKFGFKFATMWYECSPGFGKIKYVGEDGSIYVISELINFAPDDLSTKQYHRWLVSNHHDEFLLVWK